MKKILFVLGGICPEPYAYDGVVKSSFNHLGYNEIVEINYEPFLDKRYKWIPFYDKMRLLDKHGDWWQFALHPEVRGAIRAHVCAEIQSRQNSDTVVDVIAHSLGTWVILGCPLNLNKVMLFGSPLGSSSYIVRKNVEVELEKSLSLKSSVLHYCYNKKDFVSSRSPIQRVVNMCTNMLLFICGMGHDLDNYLDSYCEVFL